MIKTKHIKPIIAIMLLCTLLCGCGSSVPAIQGENFVYVSGGTYFLRNSIEERDLGIESDGSHRVNGFYNDSTLTGMAYFNEDRLAVYPVHFDEDPISFVEVTDISMGEETILSNGGMFIALTDHGLYYVNDEWELWFTDFYTNISVCSSYRSYNNILGTMDVNPVVIAAEGVNVFVLFNGELHECRLHYEYGIPSFSDSIIDRDVLGIFGDRQQYDVVKSEVKVTSDSLININMEEYTNLYYWKKDDDFDIFDYYVDENDGDINVVPSDFDGMDKQDPIIHEQWQRANIREQLQLFNESNESVCKVMYYDASKQSTEVTAEAVFVSKGMYVYENGDAFAAPFIIPLESIGDYQVSFKDMRDNSFPQLLSMIVNHAYDMINEDGIRGYILFSGEKIPIQYQCDGEGESGVISSGYNYNKLMQNTVLSRSKLYYDFTNCNLYQFVKNDKGNYTKLLCFTGDVSGTINYNTPETINTSLMGEYEEGAYVHMITKEGIIYSTNHSTESFSTGQSRGILYCNDVVLLDTGKPYTVMTARNKSYVESENDKIYEIDDRKLKPVIDKPATLIHVDRRCDATFDYVLDGYIYRWQNNKSDKISSNPISLGDGFEDIFYLIGSY